MAATAGLHRPESEELFSLIYSARTLHSELVVHIMIKSKFKIKTPAPNHSVHGLMQCCWLLADILTYTIFTKSRIKKD